MEEQEYMKGIADDLGKIGAGMPFMSKTRHADGKRPHVIPMNNERAVYEYFRTVYPKDVIVTQGFLRAVVPMPSNAPIQNIQFYFTKNIQTSNIVSIENRLDQSDVFQALYFKFGMFTLASTTAGGIPSPTAPVTYSMADIQWFNNGQVFTDANEARNLNAPYTSWLYVKIGETVYFEQFPMYHFKNVGVSQEGVAVSNVVTTGVLTATSQDGKMIKTPITPIVEIDGSGKNDFIIQLQDATILSPTVNHATRGNYMVMEAHGFKCQGAAKVQTRKIHFTSK